MTELLKTRGLIDAALEQDIANEVETSGKDVSDVLTNYQVIGSPQDLWAMIAQELDTQYYDLSEWEVPAELKGIIPPGLARLHGVIPVAQTEAGLQVAMTNPLSVQTVEDLSFAIGQPVQVVVAPPNQVEDKINETFGGDGKAMDDLLGQLEGLQLDNTANVEQEANSAPIIRYVDLVLYQAIKEKASDIHFEPFEKEFKIRYRVDGALYEMAPPPVHLSLPIISRVKVMANMNIAERRVPQDGRIVKEMGDSSVDMRVSSLPTQYGESVVLRVLDRSSVNLDMNALKLPAHIHEYIYDTIHKPNGIFIVTGPTGAGKTTTLYAALKEINTIDAKLLTAEDPVEYDIEGIIQIPVQEAIGVTFSRILRAFLRQDPDRIMVGEMRDKETAQIAIQASLTGHLVLSTLHTNDAPGAVTRLVDMGIEPFLVAASLEGILAQRLVRTICAECKAAYEPNESVLAQLGLSPHEIGDKNFYTGQGCKTCGNSGYKGRRGLFELLDINDTLADMITDRAPTVTLKNRAMELGMTTLREDGLRAIYEGATTIEEVLKYT